MTEPAVRTSDPASKPPQRTRNNQRRRNNRPNEANNGASNSNSTGTPSRRAARFNASLTNSSEGSSSQTHRQRQPRQHQVSNQADDLTSNLIRSLTNSSHECIICFNNINRNNSVWSCSPSIPIVPADPGAVPQYCWSVMHLKCIRSWSEKSYKEIEQAWIARGELGKGGEWRCPGCQGRRTRLIGSYSCFCGAVKSPKPGFGTPHSCGNPCTRPRDSCQHPCPLQCHPGPCPPCKVTIQLPCPCPRHNSITLRCEGSRVVSCNSICARPLSCGDPNHLCSEPCHQGPCSSCTQLERRKCWCGKEEREKPCGHPDVAGQGGDAPRGFSCGQPCERPFDCNQHYCHQPCHPFSADSPSVCPFSPAKILTCPCTKTPVTSRTSCTSPIPTCSSPCLKWHDTCSHPCQEACHLGDCPPCKEMVVRPCRCGSITRTIACHLGDNEILCEKACPALRACGRHQCNRICCPLASFAGKGKKRRADDIAEGAGGLHECDLVCGRTLSCGNHKCEERDHRGPCPPCLRSSFEEMICACGQTILDPPIPCGTVMTCSYPCANPPPPCGHPKTQHTCHSPSAPCPPCPFLTTRECACGKTQVKNIKCSLEREKIGCGKHCGELLACGFHRCERKCHAGDCGACSHLCGKPRKSCRHPCTQSCHAPAACQEDIPCTSIVTITCDCGRIVQSVSCNKALGPPPKCNSECAVRKRNQRLADALGIDASKHKQQEGAEYSDELVIFARRNIKFVGVVESAFASFIASNKKNQVLPHTPPDRRSFVIQLASIYRMDYTLVDQEPHRSVQIIRRVDTRLPSPLLSTSVASGLGKLGDYRSTS